MNIHLNVQALGRVWDKLREQADCYINTLRCRILDDGTAVIDTICYERYASAEKALLPHNDKQFEQTNGSVIYRSFRVDLSSLKYDSY